MPITVPEWLLSALDDYLDAMLSAAPGALQERQAEPPPGGELGSLLAVAGELIRSREWIDGRLTAWRDRRPLIGQTAARSSPIMTAGRWPALN